MSKPVIAPELLAACKLLYFQGNGLKECCDILKMPDRYSTIRKRSSDENWPGQRERKLSGKQIETDKPREVIDVASLVLDSLADRANQYKESVSKQVFSKGIDILEKNHPASISEVELHFKALGAAHHVAKDIFGIGKEVPTQNLLINMSFLNSDNEETQVQPIIEVKANQSPLTQGE